MNDNEDCVNEMFQHKIATMMMILRRCDVISSLGTLAALIWDPINNQQYTLLGILTSTHPISCHSAVCRAVDVGC